MAYTRRNFQTKKALKEALAQGDQISVFETGPSGPNIPDGVAYLEGPHYPRPHTWYASCKVVDGKVVAGSVK